VGIASYKRMNLRNTFTALVFAVVALGLAVSAPRLIAQEPAGPQAPPKQPDIMRIPAHPAPVTEQPAMPPDEIIRRFSAYEDNLARLFPTYGYRKTVRLEEIGSDGKVAGQAEIGASVPASSAPRAPAGEMQSTLRYLNLERDTVEALSKIPVFPLVSSNLPKYELSYQGKQLLDELNTYVFQVKPRQLERARAYFDGLVWIDDHDLAIVKSYGKWVTETGDVQPAQHLPFTIFETYRQPVDNKYWLPAYSRSDASYDNRGVMVPVRLIIRWDHYAPLPQDTITHQDQTQSESGR
jgi:hypothetical protein